MTDIQRAIDKQEKLCAEATQGPWYGNNFSNWFAALNLELSDSDAHLIAHLRNQAQLARDVIQAATELLRLRPDGHWLLKVLSRTLAAWADHVNGEKG